MTVDEPEPKVDGAVPSTPQVNEKDGLRVESASQTTLDVIVKASADERSGYLLAPRIAPIRPASPDTLSNLSVEEYGLLREPRAQHGEFANSAQPLSAGPRTWRGRLAHFWIVNKGIVFMLIAQVFGVLMNVTTRLLEVEGNRGKGLHPFQILFARMSITTFLASAYMWYNKTPHFPFGMSEIRWLLIARGLGGFCGVFGMYFSLLYLPLADATVITFLAPGLACFACSILLKQPFTRVEQVAGLVSLVGVVLIARPTTLFTAIGGNETSSTGLPEATPSNATAPAPADASSYGDVTPMQRLTAVGVALIGVIGSAVAYTTIRWIGKRAHPLITVNYFAAWCFIVSVVMQSALPDVGWQLPVDLKEWGYLLFLGICGFVMQFLLATALSYEKSSRTTNMVYTSMLFALLFDKLIFGHTPGIMSILGSCLILGSAIVVALQQAPAGGQQKEAPEADEESRAGLMQGMQIGEDVEGHEQLPIQEVQLRALR